MRKYFALFFSLILISACTNTSKKNEKEIIYLRLYTNVIDVFNLDRKWASSEDISYLETRDLDYGEFGGRLNICSTERFYCLRGALNVIIPKGQFNEDSWEFDGIKCKTEKFTDDSNKEITCSQNSHSVSFVFSYTQGIISYSRTSQPNRQYELVGNEGLFAQP